MTCNEIHTTIVLAVYGELADERMHQLQQHLHGCPSCSMELEQTLAMKTLAEALPMAEPEANLVARSRMRLEDALDRLPPKRRVLVLHVDLPDCDEPVPGPVAAQEDAARRVNGADRRAR